jgi:hypothetical protein
MAFLRRGALLADLTRVVEYSTKQVQFHRDQLSQLNQFVSTLGIIVDAELPEFSTCYSDLSTRLSEALSLESDVTSAEERETEDLNDIAARFEVVFRIQQECVDARAKLQACRERIAKAQRALSQDAERGGAHRGQLEIELRQAIEAKKQAIAYTDAKLEEQIAIREKYTAMKVRRFRHAYEHLGDVMGGSFRKEASVLKSLQISLSAAQQGIEEILNGGQVAVAVDEPIASPIGELPGQDFGETGQFGLPAEPAPFYTPGATAFYNPPPEPSYGGAGQVEEPPSYGGGGYEYGDSPFGD